MVGLNIDGPTTSRSQALLRLASIDPIELCNEAKVERCRATRDLRSCGRKVPRVLIPCGHAALCEECSQRCEVCPICRMVLPKGGKELPLRLYYECIEAGFISKKYDDRLRDKEDGENQLDADVQRLYLLFDVSLENNLVSLICHCIPIVLYVSLRLKDMGYVPSLMSKVPYTFPAINSAVGALLKYKAAQSANEKPQLLPRDDYFYLNLTLKKLPSNPRTNPYRIPLPHPVLDASSELCLIVDDRTGTTTPPSDQIKKLIKSQNIPISKVIKISKLKTNYKPFEAKRKLCDSYDLFLVDKRVVHLLPKLLGKEFFKKKKLPLGVDLSKKNIKLQVERALGSALFYVRTGTCCVMKVGKVEMEKDEIVENVLEAVKGAVENVPKKWDGVRSLHLKFSNSMALPIYLAMPDVRLKIEGLKDIQQGGDSDNNGDKGISGSKDGKNGKKSKKTKGRIHEVRYMDVGEDVDSDIDGMDENERVKSNEEDESAAKKEMEEELVQKSDDDESKKSENEELMIDDTVGKKRRKGKAQEKGVSRDSDGKKRVKKSIKIEEAVAVKPKKDGGLEESVARKGKRKSEVSTKSTQGIGKVKDVKKKKRASAK